MAEIKGSGSKSAVFGLIILAGLGAGGYYGFDTLKKEITRTQSVVVDLKSVTVKEIRASSSKTVTEVQKIADGAALSGGRGGAAAASKTITRMTQDLAQLKKDMAAMRSGQQAIIDKLKAEVAAAKSMPVLEPRVKIVTQIAKPFARTIYFPLNKVMGPNVDNQINQVVEALTKEAAGRTCEVTVDGYSDTLGADKSNLELSKKRADYVAGKLRFQDFNVVRVKAWGERRLIAYTTDGVDQVRNRRVEVGMVCTDVPEPKTDPARPMG